MKKILLLLVAILVMSFTGHQIFKASNPEASGIEIGDKAPEFKLKDIDGKEYSFDNIKDAKGNKPKGYIVVFTCNTCPYAKANEGRLIELHNTYSPKGYPVVAIQPNDPSISPGDSFEAMKKNAKDKGFPFLYLLDERQEIFPQYGATRTPEIYLIDANRILRYHGAIDDSPRDESAVDQKFLEEAIQALNRGAEVKTKTTKAVGCGIKTA